MKRTLVVGGSVGTAVIILLTIFTMVVSAQATLTKKGIELKINEKKDFFKKSKYFPNDLISGEGFWILWDILATIFGYLMAWVVWLFVAINT